MLRLTIVFLLACGLHAQVLDRQAPRGFYPGSKAELRSAVDAYLEEAPAEKVKGEILGAIVPHAGYAFSADTAARVYKLLKGRTYSTVIILSPGHRQRISGAATLDKGALRTPLGEVPVDAAVVKKLKKLSPLIEHSRGPFMGEHALEVQLPFLQRVLKGKFKVVPLLMNSDDPEVLRKVGEAVAKVFKRGKTLLLVSSDLSHYPPKDMARIVDTASLKALLRRPDEPRYFMATNRSLLQRGDRSLSTAYCGEAGVVTALYAMRKLGGVGRLLHYTNSGEMLIGDPKGVVGYAALVWTKGEVKAKLPELTAKQKKNLLQIARKTLTRKLVKEKDYEPVPALWRDPMFNLPEAVFVTLKRRGVPKRRQLRGCIGSLEPRMPLAEAVQHFAIQAALHDHRFPPVKGSELAGLRIEISRLTPFRRVKSHKEVKVGQGVLIRKGRRQGLFLPQVWDQLKTKAEFLGEICEQKAHLPRDCWKDPKTEIEVFDDLAFEEH